MSNVTVVIPVYNRAALIGRCLESVFAQTTLPDRIIVIDNNSTDSSELEALRCASAHSSKGVKVSILSERKPGASAARNNGLAQVDTKFVLFFDSDDVMHPDLIEKALAAIGDADLVHWKARVVDVNGRTKPKSFYSGNLLRRHFYNCILATQTYMARTDLIRRVGGWEERALVWNDWELGVRVAMASPKAISLPETLVTIYAQTESITGTRYSAKRGEWEQTLDLVQDVIEASGRPDRERLLDMLDYRRAILAATYRRERSFTDAGRLIADALRRPKPFWKSCLLRLLYRYSAAGGRAAYYLWRQ